MIVLPGCDMCSPWKAFGPSPTPQAQETPSGAVQEGKSIPALDVQVSLEMTLVFQIPPEVRCLDGMFWGSKYLHTDGVWKHRVIQQKWQFLTFVEGLCSNLPWKCGNFCHSSWFLKVDSGVWICQNNSCGGLYPGFKSCQAKGGWLTTETNGLHLKMDEWEFPFGMVQPGRCQLLVSGCWFCFQTWPSKSKMTRHWNLHVFWQTPADPRTENTSSASSPNKTSLVIEGYVSPQCLLQEIRLVMVALGGGTLKIPKFHKTYTPRKVTWKPKVDGL